MDGNNFVYNMILLGVYTALMLAYVVIVWRRPPWLNTWKYYAPLFMCLSACSVAVFSFTHELVFSGWLYLFYAVAWAWVWLTHTRNRWWSRTRTANFVRSAGVLIEVFPTGQPGRVGYAVQNIGPEELTQVEVVRTLRAVANQAQMSWKGTDPPGTYVKISRKRIPPKWLRVRTAVPKAQKISPRSRWKKFLSRNR